MLPVFDLPDSPDDPWADIIQTLSIMRRMDGRLTQAVSDALDARENKTTGPRTTDAPEVEFVGEIPDELVDTIRDRIGLREVEAVPPGALSNEEILAWLRDVA